MKAITSLVLCALPFALFWACASPSGSSGAYSEESLAEGSNTNQAAIEVSRSETPEVRYYVIADT